VDNAASSFIAEPLREGLGGRVALVTASGQRFRLRQQVERSQSA
jgi:hypothetical protein